MRSGAQEQVPESLRAVKDRFLAAVPALRPDVTIVHAQRADKSGNTQIWGLMGVQKEAAFASKKVIVVVEELVDELVGIRHLVPEPGLVDPPAQEVVGRRAGLELEDGAVFRDVDRLALAVGSAEPLRPEGKGRVVLADAREDEALLLHDGERLDPVQPQLAEGIVEPQLWQN